MINREKVILIMYYLYANSKKWFEVVGGDMKRPTTKKKFDLG
mgnify:FL=1|jgi:hypothetical protein